MNTAPLPAVGTSVMLHTYLGDHARDVMQSPSAGHTRRVSVQTLDGKGEIAAIPHRDETTNGNSVYYFERYAGEWNAALSSFDVVDLATGEHVHDTLNHDDAQRDCDRRNGVAS